MPKYRKKPVVIEARRVPVYDPAGSIEDFLNKAIELGVWCGSLTHLMTEEGKLAYPGCVVAGPHVAISTLEGVMAALPGDYIIKGVQGEFYPCKPDIFDATYDLVEDA